MSQAGRASPRCGPKVRDPTFCVAQHVKIHVSIDAYTCIQNAYIHLWMSVYTRVNVYKQMYLRMYAGMYVCNVM